MSEPVEKLETQSPGSSRARLTDTLARYVITAGGVFIIVCVIGIIAFILLESAPLASGATVQVVGDVSRAPGGTAPLVVGTDEYRDVLFELHPDARIVFRDLPGGEIRSTVRLPGAGDAEITSARLATSDDLIAWGDESGRLGLAQVVFRTEYLEGGGRDISTRVRNRGAVDLSVTDDAPKMIAGGQDEDGFITLLTVLQSGAVRVGMYDADDEEWALHDLTSRVDAAPTSVAVAQDGTMGVVGTKSGDAFLWAFEPWEDPEYLERVGVTSARDVAVTASEFLLGDQSLVIGATDGGLSVWSQVPPPPGEEGERRLKRIHAFPDQPTPVQLIAGSPRDKGFLTAGSQGEIRLHFSTSERTLGDMQLSAPASGLVLTPRADGVIAVGPDGEATQWAVDNPHPEVSFRTLFGRVWYEGLGAPAWVWQSTGGTDDFEPKLSLVPLIFGTLKGAIYAMLFSVPIAIFGAIYTSQFASRRVKNLVKPFVEILAALPSVIVGFLAGLWLAPLLIRILPGVTLMLGLVPLALVGSVFAFEALPQKWRRHLHSGNELYVAMVVVLLSGWVSLALGPSVERAIFGGDFVQWIRNSAGLVYDPRNCAVVGFALGFAVIPIIFTIAEDALSSVPRHLVTASLALGANRWTTTWRVVVPTASAGIFAAIMLGFGRAVGETMIVLMATGNTPILDWNIFNGMRTLSANIATEIPEAPLDGTLYRILFLSGALLFVLTFFTNSLAEIVGHRLRRKYQRL